MYIINLRQDGINGNAFSETEQLFHLNRHRQLDQLSEAELMQTMEHKNILMLVHGVNLSITDVLSFYLTLDQQHVKSLATHYDVIIGFIWSGGEARF